jgi:uncharacterized protein YdaU (DUF1376 family)
VQYEGAPPQMLTALVRFSGLPPPSRQSVDRESRDGRLDTRRPRDAVDSLFWLEGEIAMAHFYSWFPGDYMRDTAHLSMVEDAAYRRLIDSYYMTGKLQAIACVLLRVCRAVTPEEQDAVSKVATEFFTERNGYLFNEKIEHELARSRSVSLSRSESGKRGASEKKRRRSAMEAAIAKANAMASASANELANQQQPIPSVYTVGKPTVTAAPSSAPSSPKEVIFTLGVSILTGQGDKESQARSFLGKFAGKDEAKLAEVIGYLAANPKVQAKGYIAGAFKPEARELVI